MNLLETTALITLQLMKALRIIEDQYGGVIPVIQNIHVLVGQKTYSAFAVGDDCRTDRVKVVSEFAATMTKFRALNESLFA